MVHISTCARNHGFDGHRMLINYITYAKSGWCSMTLLVCRDSLAELPWLLLGSLNLLNVCFE